MPNRKINVLTLALLSAAMPSLVRAAERPPTDRGCIPGPHEPGRMRRMVGQAVSSAQPWAYHPDVDQRPHCLEDEPASGRR